MTTSLRHLAYTRATSRLRQENEERFRELVDEEWQSIRVEQIVTGDVERVPASTARHRAGDGGVCVVCGKRSPCRPERKRTAYAEARARGLSVAEARLLAR